MRALLSVVSAVLLAASLTPGPAAAQTVDVDFVVSLGVASPPGPEYAECTVSVAPGADGEQVLDAAVSAGCIDSHSGSHHDQGYFVECIDGICEAVVTYWAFFVNDEMADTGVSLYEASAGDTFELSYQTWAHCLAEWVFGVPVCDPRP